MVKWVSGCLDVLHLPRGLVALVEAPFQCGDPTGIAEQAQPHPAPLDTVDLDQAAVHADGVNEAHQRQSQSNDHQRDLQAAGAVFPEQFQDQIDDHRARAGQAEDPALRLAPGAARQLLECVS